MSKGFGGHKIRNLLSLTTKGAKVYAKHAMILVSKGAILAQYCYPDRGRITLKTSQRLNKLKVIYRK